MSSATIAALNVYPVKSCRGTSLQRAGVGATGLFADRRWMVVDEAGRFLTQRSVPRLALVVPELHDQVLTLRAPQAPELQLSADAAAGTPVAVSIWKEQCAALDAGEAAAQWFCRHLGRPARLVRFDPAARRLSNRQWTGEVQARNEFSDGFPFLLLSIASLDDLNARLPAPLPMNRFRPNIVLSGVQAYDEDRIHELVGGGIRLRLVKGCTRCRITMTDQSSAEVQGPQPLLALRAYRWDEKLRGMVFGQNAINAAGADGELHVGQQLQIIWKQHE